MPTNQALSDNGPNENAECGPFHEVRALLGYTGGFTLVDIPRTGAEVCRAVLHSWEALDPISFKPEGAVTAAFLRIGAEDLRSAAKYVRCLPYARNTRPDDPLIVLTEKRGTCSTKHALLRRLAIEQDLDVALVLGIYEMAEQNTPGVGGHSP